MKRNVEVSAMREGFSVLMKACKQAWGVQVLTVYENVMEDYIRPPTQFLQAMAYEPNQKLA